MKILIVEDDARTADLIAAGLAEAGHQVEMVADGERGYALARAGTYDVAIIDRMLPGIDGLTLARRLRESGNPTPLLFLTTMSGIDDRVEGLEAGGDDYLVKPFAFAELLARVHALGRRPPLAPSVGHILRAVDVEMDLIARVVRRSDRVIDLQPREFRLLEVLMRNAGQVLTRRMLLEQVWDFHFDPKTNIVETHISRLRGKIDRGFELVLIETIRGEGYLLRDCAL